MAQAAAVDSWSELFIVTIQPQGGSAVDAQADITTYDVNGGDKSFSGIANGKGGRIKKFEPQGEFDIVLEGYTTDAAFWGALHTLDGAEPQSIPTDRTRVNYLLSILHTTSTSITSAVSVTADGDRALRQTYKNGHLTNVRTSFTDGICKFTITYRCLPFAKDGSSNVTYESTDGSASNVLPAITYT